MSQTGLLLRLTGPLQSWGERSVFTVRDTAVFPTRSGLLGMIAAAEGLPRGSTPDDYGDMVFTIRIDRPGTRIVDFHTVGGGYIKELSPITAKGGHKGEAVISRRHYVADAAFTVALTGPAETVGRITAALEHPYWAPHLGRRSCPPDEPLLLGTGISDPVTQLRQHVPLACALRHGHDQDTVPVDFIWEDQPGRAEAVPIELNDMRDDQAGQRRFRPRRVWRTTEHLPASLADTPDGDRQTRLIDYVLGSTPR